MSIQSLVVGLICLAIGFVAGLIFSDLRQESEQKTQSHEDIPGEPLHVETPVYPPSSTLPINPTLAIIPILTASALPADHPHQSMVEQINDILQKDLLASPLHNTLLTISELPEGVVVWVGNQSYLGVDAMPAGEARDLVQTAVRKWELK